MKRYVKEFLSDEINKHMEVWRTYGNTKAIDIVAKLRTVLDTAERGMITDFEAVKKAVEIVEEDKILIW